ncbi:ras-like GTP-binding protein Rho1 [Oscarella lobularis]|uniref:ras-like GTP-binding protein Rho1 n=1 Tax=Oscarella lobularis TaxID=121494 RepID=UPI003313E127
MTAAPKTVKVVTVGDGACGKSSLLLRFCKDLVIQKYEPTLFENYAAEIELRPDLNLELALFDTAGNVKYDRLRPLSYPDCDVVIVCYDLSEGPNSIETVKNKWKPELDEYCPHVPFVVVGCKQDIRWEESFIDDRCPAQGKQRPLKKEEAAGFAAELGAFAYIECSALSSHNVVDVFVLAAEASLAKRKKRNKLKRKLSRSSRAADSHSKGGGEKKKKRRRRTCSIM